MRKERAEPFDMKVKAAFDNSHRRYGSGRLAVELIAQGAGPSRSTVVRSLRRQGLQARPRRRFVVTTDSAHVNPIAPNLLNRDFAPKGPNQVWALSDRSEPQKSGLLVACSQPDFWS